jgi:hypothetical protein
MPTEIQKTCEACGESKPIIQFPSRRKRCQSCLAAEKAARDAKRLERKEAVAYTEALGERIVDAIASGMTVAEVCASSWGPTERQLARWRRTIPELREALDEARAARADVRSDRVDQALNDLRAGKITAADCRVIVETELKMAARENPARYGEKLVSDVTVRPGAPEEKPDTAAWLERVLSAAVRADNVIPLLPVPKPAEEDAA